MISRNSKIQELVTDFISKGGWRNGRQAGGGQESVSVCWERRKDRRKKGRLEYFCSLVATFNKLRSRDDNYFHGRGSGGMEKRERQRYTKRLTSDSSLIDRNDRVTSWRAPDWSTRIRRDDDGFCDGRWSIQIYNNVLTGADLKLGRSSDRYEWVGAVGRVGLERGGNELISLWFHLRSTARTRYSGEKLEKGGTSTLKRGGE